VSDQRDFREVVAAKRDARELEGKDLRALVLGYARGDVPDYLAAAFLMAAYIHGLSARETVDLTRAMIDSGATVPLASVGRPKVDKHSTGGVSDGVTLVFAPLAASLGLAVAKLSGRGLGHTGGTLDKLESIPGLRTGLALDELERQVEAVGCAVAAQTEDLVPADGALYALRDATATVSSVPLIAASVMSKKLAVGTDLVLLDVKAGSGAFMKTPEEAAELARACVALAQEWNRPVRAAVTDMSQPLGRAIGNALEVAETVSVLQGKEGGRLRELAVAFASLALTVLLGEDSESARSRTEQAIDSGAALETFGTMVGAQGGDPRVVDAPWDVLPQAPVVVEAASEATGWLAATDAEALGRASVVLGAGRLTKDAAVDPAVGIEFLPLVGDRLEAGQPVARIHARDEETAAATTAMILQALEVSEEPPEPGPLVFGWHGTNEDDDR
jgi:pyrimidine-nucleoside phosphorylase